MKEMKYEVEGKYCTTTCPNGVELPCAEGHVANRPKMMVGSGECRECTHFLGQDTEKQIVECLHPLRDDKLIICLFGLSDSGKTSVATALSDALISATTIDAKAFRAFTGNGSFCDMGRKENIQSLCSMLDVLEGKGIYILSFSIPTLELRDVLKQRHNSKFVLCESTIETCRGRDSFGYYKQADHSLDVLLPGVNLPFDTDGADLIVDTEDHYGITPEGNHRRCADEVIRNLVVPWLKRSGSSQYYEI